MEFVRFVRNESLDTLRPRAALSRYGDIECDGLEYRLAGGEGGAKMARSERKTTSPARAAEWGANSEAVRSTGESHQENETRDISDLTIK